MKNKIISKTLACGTTTLAILAGIGIAAQAEVKTTGCAAENQFCTLHELLIGDGKTPATIQVGDKKFTMWTSVTNTKTGGIGGVVDLGNIRVSGIAQDTEAPGLQFTSIPDSMKNNELQVVGKDGRLTLEFDFKVEVVEPGLSRGDQIVGSKLNLTVPDANGPTDPGDMSNVLIKIDEKVGTDRGLEDIATKVVSSEINPFQETTMARGNFSDPPVLYPFVWVRDTITLQTNGNGALAGIREFQQTFSQCNPNIVPELRNSQNAEPCPTCSPCKVPEPSTSLSLLAFGALGVGAMLKLNRKQQSLN